MKTDPVHKRVEGLAEGLMDGYLYPEEFVAGVISLGCNPTQADVFAEWLVVGATTPSWAAYRLRIHRQKPQDTTINWGGEEHQK